MTDTTEALAKCDEWEKQDRALDAYAAQYQQWLDMHRTALPEALNIIRSLVAENERLMKVIDVGGMMIERDRDRIADERNALRKQVKELQQLETSRHNDAAQWRSRCADFKAKLDDYKAAGDDLAEDGESMTPVYRWYKVTENHPL